jgi:hypothetical protein
LTLSWPQTYAALLAVFAFFASARLVNTLWRHTTLVVLSVFSVLAVRNIWPLMTFTLHPLDSVDGTLLWAKVALAALAGGVLPLIEPTTAHVSASTQVRL